MAATPTSDDDVVRIRVLTAKMADGALLSVGEDLERSRQLQAAFLRTFILTSGAALFIALAVGLSYVTRILRRIEVIAGTADAVSTSGEMGLRAPVRPPERRDDIDQLAMAMNRMLDEIQRLVLSVRQVSDAVAHDLRTPLAHLRQRVEVRLALRETAELLAGVAEQHPAGAKQVDQLGNERHTGGLVAAAQCGEVGGRAG